MLSPAFYYWKTTLSPSDEALSILKTTHANPLYIRFFDVDWKPGQGAVPVSPLQIDASSSLPASIIPVVFITNRTMINIDSKDIDTLAGRMLRKIDFIAHHFPATIQEIQLDCDWSATSRQHFFSLLESLQKRVQGQNITISSTLRLHQYRYPNKTGIPPVSKVMLMLYNMGDVGDPEETNSILNIDEARSYIEGGSAYPLPLDIAVPIFGWGALFREGKLINLLKGLKGFELADSLRFHKIDENHFEVVKSTYLNGVYLYKDDQIRLEDVPVELLFKTIPLLRKVINQPKTCIAFYHLDSSIQKEFSNETIRRFFNEIKK